METTGSILWYIIKCVLVYCRICHYSLRYYDIPCCIWQVRQRGPDHPAQRNLLRADQGRRRVEAMRVVTVPCWTVSSAMYVGDFR